MRKLDSRFNWPRTGFKNSEQYGRSCILTFYFKEGVYKNIMQCADFKEN